MIGVFDSGFGGLSIFRAIERQQPIETDLIYLGDSQRVPYGNKDFEQIRSIAKEICNRFEDYNLDALLVACNTTNASALDI